eukprot:maker-scaffold6902_size3520-snap-gene-0.4 protein:Tk09598 transcript:maker-scaffold6902_size3520-snap-gene-0.4-mRNA-1 annotation:"2-hydroxyacid dehydrogenase"
MRTRIEAECTLHNWADHDMAWLHSNGAAITRVVTNGGTGMPADVMAALPNLQMISSNGVGYDSIDVAEAARRGIMVTHTPNVLNAEVATTAVMLMLACYREMLRDDAYVRSVIGRRKGAIADKLAPWNPTIVYHSRTKKDVAYKYYDNLTDMAAACDLLICITPGGPQTDKLVNAQVLAALGPEGTLINVARGSVVDEAALIDALQTGKLGWAGLDVFENEPHVPQALCDLPNTVLLPHAGSATVETRAAMGALTVDNLLQHIKDGTVISATPECAHLG